MGELLVLAGIVVTGLVVIQRSSAATKPCPPQGCTCGLDKGYEIEKPLI